MGLVALACQNQKKSLTPEASGDNGCRKPAAALGTTKDFKLSAAHLLAQASPSPTAMTDTSATPSASASASPEATASTAPAGAASASPATTGGKTLVKLGFLGDLTGGNA